MAHIFQSMLLFVWKVVGSIHGSLPEEGDSVLEEPSSFRVPHIQTHTITSHLHTDPGTDI